MLINLTRVKYKNCYCHFFLRLEDISKHFGGLQVTDFPLYVQGLEFKQNPNPKSSQSIVLTQPAKPSNGKYINKRKT